MNLATRESIGIIKSKYPKGSFFCLVICFWINRIKKKNIII
jgi:hypothetical protein